MNPAEEYILSREEPYRGILLHLKALICVVIPDVRMTYKWNVPCFYAGNHSICYFNASYKGKYVDIAFWNSAHLTKHLELMYSGNRKVVKSFRYQSLEEIDDHILTEVLTEAYSLKYKGFNK